jgi:hypothetical protein
MLVFGGSGIDCCLEVEEEDEAAGGGCIDSDSGTHSPWW